MTNESVTNDIWELRQDIDRLSDLLLKKKRVTSITAEITAQDGRIIQEAREVVQRILAEEAA